MGRQENFLVSGIFVWCILFLGGCQKVQSDSYQKVQSGVQCEFPLTVPLVYHADLKSYFVPVTIASNEHLFMVDTGSPATMFDDDFEELLGKYMTSHNMGTVEGKGLKLRVHSSGPDNFYVGNTKVDFGIVACVDNPIREYNLPDISGMPKGIIGRDLWKDRIVQFDYVSKEMRVLDSDQNHKEWGHSVSLKKDSKAGHPVIEVQLSKSIKGDFVIDTGFLDNAIILQPELFDQMKEKKGVQYVRKKFTSGERELIMIPRVGIGDLRVKNLIFKRKPDYVKLEYNFLTSYFFKQIDMITLDYINNKAYIKYQGN